MPLTSHDECKKSYKKRGYDVTSRMICAGAGKGKIDTCHGDSGGPMVCEAKGCVWYVVGATSWGVGCARRGVYGVYTNVNALRPWIDQVVYNG